MELQHCKKCNQMTNHEEGVCLKCGNIKFCCLCGKHHKEGECKAFNEENEKFVINRVNNMENEIIKRFRDVFIFNHGSKKTWGLEMAEEMERFILSELKALKEELLSDCYEDYITVAKAFEKRGV